MNRSMAILVALIGLVLFSGCTTIVVNERDTETIGNLEELKDCYLQDLATSMTWEDEGQVVTPEDIGEDTSHLLAALGGLLAVHWRIDACMRYLFARCRVEAVEADSAIEVRRSACGDS